MVRNHQTVRLGVGAIAASTLCVSSEHSNVICPVGCKAGQGIASVCRGNCGGVEAGKVGKIVGLHFVFGDGRAAVGTGQTAAHAHWTVVGQSDQTWKNNKKR